MHLVRGNYGPQSGVRGQDAHGSSVRLGGGCGGGRPVASASAASLRHCGGVADSEDVDDILQQVRKDVRAIQQTSSVRTDQELDGRWLVRGHAASVQIVIAGCAIQMADGSSEQPIIVTGPGKFYVDDQGQQVTGELLRHEIHWSDGDVWVRAQDGQPAATSSGARIPNCRGAEPGPQAPSVVKQMSRSFSEATWDRPKTRENAQDVVPRAAPKATVRGRYVFSGAETQVLGQMGRGIGSQPDFADELASAFSPRPSGAGPLTTAAKAPTLGSYASSRQLPGRGRADDPLPAHPETPDCTDL